MPPQIALFLFWPVVAGASLVIMPESATPFGRKDMVLLCAGLGFLVVCLWQAETYGVPVYPPRADAVKGLLVLSMAYLSFPFRQHLKLRAEIAVAAACTLAYLPAFAVFHLGIDPDLQLLASVAAAVVLAHAACTVAVRMAWTAPPRKGD